MSDQDRRCELCRFWRQRKFNALIGDCLSDRSGRAFTRRADSCPEWAVAKPDRRPDEPANS